MESNQISTINLNGPEKIKSKLPEFERPYTEIEESIINKDRLFKTHELIEDLPTHLYNNLKNVEGFDFRWSSLITCKPFLFEDLDYVKSLPFVDNQITDYELKMYKEGKIRKIYPNIEYMLMDNLMYYSRIMRFCSIAFLKYVRLENNEVVSEPFQNVATYFNLTPTKIWCCAMSTVESTKEELEYAWNMKLKEKPVDLEVSYLQFNWQRLYGDMLFAKFMEGSAYVLGTQGFRETFIKDKTSNVKLGRVCKKYTNTTVALSEEAFETIYEYHQEQEEIHQKLYNALYNCLLEIFDTDNEFAIYIFANEFYLHTSKFSMRVTKSADGKISKDYLGNNLECFAAEEFLVNSIRAQIEWAKFKIPNKYDYDKTILKNMLYNMLKTNYKDVICCKRMNDFGVISKVIFKGVFKNVYIIEQLMLNNRVIRETKTCFSKKNAAKYVIDRGYVVCGFEKDVLDLMINPKLNTRLLTDHYMQYCISVSNYMKDVVRDYTASLNEIINVVCNNYMIDIKKLNNHEIKYSILKADTKDNLLAHELFAKALNNQNQSLERKSYWKIIEDA
jgi:hypothetical protein